MYSPCITRNLYKSGDMTRIERVASVFQNVFKFKNFQCISRWRRRSRRERPFWLIKCFCITLLSLQNFFFAMHFYPLLFFFFLVSDSLLIWPTRFSRLTWGLAQILQLRWWGVTTTTKMMGLHYIILARTERLRASKWNNRLLWTPDTLVQYHLMIGTRRCSMVRVWGMIRI